MTTKTTKTTKNVWLCFSHDTEDDRIDCDAFKALTTNSAKKKVEQIMKNFKRYLIEIGEIEKDDYAEYGIESVSDTVIIGSLNMDYSHVQFAAYRLEDLLNNM